MILTLLTTLLLSPFRDRITPNQGTLIGHAALLGSDRTTGKMLEPAKERWAVAVIKGVSDYRLREAEIDGEAGPWDTFDVDLDVIDGWNVPLGTLTAFWWEGSASRRFVLARMVGQRVLVRFAPIKDGKHLLVGTSVIPSFVARPGESFVSIILPYPGTKLETGEPRFRGWKTLWRAGLALDPIAFPDFSRYMDIAMPITPPKGRTKVFTKYDSYEKENPGLADAAWLFRLAQEGTPEYRMLIAEYLDRDGIEGSLQMKRDLILLALRQPDAFPNGFLRVGGYYDLNRKTAKGYEQWLPISKVVDAILATRSSVLAGDLLELLIYPKYFVADRAKLLPLLSHPDSYVRDQAIKGFELWHGKPPNDTDPAAWHRARAELSQEQLRAATTASGG